MTSRNAIIGLFAAVVMLALPSSASAADNDLRLSRLAEPFGGSLSSGNYGQGFDGCTNACGIVEPNEQQFQSLVSDLGQVFAPRLANPAETLGEAGFAVNMMTSLSFIPNEEEYWRRAVEDGSPSSSLFTGHLQVRKGLPFSFEVAGNMGYLFASEMFTLGADLKWALNEGFYYFPDVAFRGSVNTLMGSSDLNLISAGGDMSISKAFGLGGVASLTPYLGYQVLFIIGSSRLLNAYPQDPRSPQFDDSCPGAGANDPSRQCTTFAPEFVFSQYDTSVNRFFFGARLNVWVLNFVLEGVIASPSNENAGAITQATFAGGVDF